MKYKLNPHEIYVNQPYTVWQPVVPYTVPTLGVKVSVTNTPQPEPEPELMDLTKARAVLKKIMSL
jgi:hypothetical protein